MFAPMRPRPIMPSCILSSCLFSSSSYGRCRCSGFTCASAQKAAAWKPRIQSMEHTRDISQTGANGRIYAHVRPTRRLRELGQSLWLDNISRKLLENGGLRRYIDEFSVTGLTSNPTIFEKAIKDSDDYD